MKDTKVHFTLNKCKTKSGWSAKATCKLNLEKVSKGHEIELETPVLIVIKTECGKTIIHEYGEIIFRECDDEKLMNRIAKDIYSKGA